MALLDALTYVIEADASRLDRQIDDSEKRTSDLEDSLKRVENQSRKTSMTFSQFVKAGLGYLAAYLSVTKAFAAAGARADFVSGLVQVSGATNTAIEDVDALGKSLELMGGSADGAAGTLQSLSNSVGKALNEVNSQQAKVFASLGVNLRDAQGNARSTIDVMRDLSSAVEGMDTAQAVARLNQLGISDRTSIELILKGRQELDRLLRTQREAGVVTKESAENAQKYNEALFKLRQGFGNIGSSLIDSLIPILTKVIEWVSKIVDWFGKHEHIVKGFFIGIAGVLAAIYLPAMASAAAATIAATWPFLLIGAAIAALIALFVLIYDDIMNFIEGNDSLIGQIIEKYPVVGDVIETLGNIFGFFAEIVGKALGGALEFGKGFVNGMVEGFEFLSDVVSSVFGFIVDTVKGALDFITKAWEKISAVASGIKSALGFGDKELTANTSSNLYMAGQQMAAINANPLNAVTPGAISNASNTRTEQNLSVGEINIQTQATDAQGISQGIGSELRDQLQSLQSESATGVVS